MIYFHPAWIGFGLICLVFLYTIHLVRSKRLSAHVAIPWVGTELLLMAVMAAAGIRNYALELLGGTGASYSLFLVGAVWVVFLMLDSLTRISTLTGKLKDLTQALALTTERLERLEGEASRKLDPSRE